MVYNERRIERKRIGIIVRPLTSLEANSFSSGRLHVSDRHWPSRAVSSMRSEAKPSATLEWSTTVHVTVSSDKQLGRYPKNGVSIREVKAISLAACKVGLAFLKLNFYFSISIMSTGMGVVPY